MINAAVDYESRFPRRNTKPNTWPGFNACGSLEAARTAERPPVSMADVMAPVDGPMWRRPKDRGYRALRARHQ
ncbi:hypothetical protein [Rugosimonospora africana]|uniref:Uncharacterized protein n=1 Tax=Rugosimonospora africana TaxID=556532 RepID=A0A8J3VSK7_9ACTN|nr:hypothetical protein [Rugosimonospora africana]GIH16706.1 hypothetical protein Raf01_48780 [Rugosimonospora africana]